jgi:hypothetical protein
MSRILSPRTRREVLHAGGIRSAISQASVWINAILLSKEREVLKRISVMEYTDKIFELF